MHSVLSHFFESATQQITNRSVQSLETLKERLKMPRHDQTKEVSRQSMKQKLMKFFKEAPSVVKTRTENAVREIKIPVIPQVVREEYPKQPKQSYSQIMSKIGKSIADNHNSSISKFKQAMVIQATTSQTPKNMEPQSQSITNHPQEGPNINQPQLHQPIISHRAKNSNQFHQTPIGNQQPPKIKAPVSRQASNNLMNFFKNSYSIVKTRHQVAMQAANKLIASHETTQIKQELRQTADFPKNQQAQLMEISEKISQALSKPDMEVSLLAHNVVAYESTSKNQELNTPPILAMSRQPTFSKQNNTDLTVQVNHPKEQFEDVEHFAEYVEQERLEKLRQDIDQLKRQHLKTHTNYDASDEQSASVSSQVEYQKSKLKTDISMGRLQRVFVPMIQVNEAPSDGEWVEDRKLPNTDPKAKKKKTVHKKLVISSLPKSTIVKSKFNRIEDANVEDYAQKMLRLKEARQKKLLLQMKLQQINRQITDIRNPQKSLSQIKSPKNSMKEMVNIANDVDAKIKAVSLVSKLKQEREKREMAANNIFNRVDNAIMESIAQLSKLRRQQEKKSKEKRKLDVLQRMKEHERKKQEASRMQLANNSFVQALKYYDKKNGVLDRKSLAWRNEDTPELIARKQVLEKLRDLTHNEKRSLIEQYNRDLLRK